MSKFLSQLIHYLVRILDFSLTLGGTSRVGFFALLLAPPVWSAFQETREVVKHGSTWKQALSKMKPMSLIRKPVVFIWLCLAVWSLGAVTYQDHQRLVEARNEAKAETQTLVSQDRKTILELQEQLTEAKSPARKALPEWTWKATPGLNQGAMALITARSALQDMTFLVKCSSTCNEQGSQAMTGTGTWLDPHPTADPTVVRVKVLVPDRLNPGQQIALSFYDPTPDVVGTPRKNLSILWVRMEKGTKPKI